MMNKINNNTGVVDNGAVEFRDINIKPDIVVKSEVVTGYQKLSDTLPNILQNNLEQKLVIMDSISPLLVGTKSQDSWIEYWNRKKDKVMASMPEYYQMFKQLHKDITQGQSKERRIAESWLRNFRKELAEGPYDYSVLTSTTVQYFVDNDIWTGRIIHHYNCNKPELVTLHIVQIPAYTNTPIYEVLNDTLGLELVQKYFETKDNKESIAELLSFIGERNIINVRLTTMTCNGYARLDHEQTPVDMAYYDNNFVIGGMNRCDCNFGRSRGVKYR
jgi:hypothetical protein